jgi:hypothetical protein
MDYRLTAAGFGVIAVKQANLAADHVVQRTCAVLNELIWGRTDCRDC